ncbi:hypothetical protein HAX54_022316 [Datura stramonium]|uniref:RNase H type-1 domain-containing protein n=1 Tax=Datura stramonium TaxID=4076 RepID=A0ABS8UW52_DATST|nr:hypothetical protein [Datura stramonium]
MRFPEAKEMPSQWKLIVRLLETFKPHIRSQVVIWRKPNRNWFKCNIDGACRGNPEEGTDAYCIKDEKGDFIHVEARRLGIISSLSAEATTIERGIEHYVGHNRLPVLIESDSLVMINILEGRYKEIQYFPGVTTT